MALDFDGVDDGVDIGANANLNPTLTMTVGCWINLDNTTGSHGFICRGHYGGGPAAESGGYSFKTNGDELRFTKHAVADITSTGINLSASAWLYVAAAISSTNVRFYKITTAGVMSTEDVANSSAFDSTFSDDSRIGLMRGDSGQAIDPMAGLLCNVIHVGATLTDVEVAAMAFMLPMRPDVVKGFWPLWGTTTAEPDWSGFNFHGTVTGAVRVDHPPGICAIFPQARRPQATVAAAGDPEGSLIAGKLLRGGLLTHGVLVR